MDIWGEKSNTVCRSLTLTGDVTLFVVNRDFETGSSAIEVLEFDESTYTLVHKKSIKHVNIYW